MASVPKRPNQNDVEMEEVQSQPRDRTGTTPVSRSSGVSTPQDVQQEAEQQQREPSIEIGVQASDLPRPALPDAGSQHVALQVVRDSIDVNGVHLTASSPVATLRGACKYLSLPSSGGKQSFSIESLIILHPPWIEDTQ